MSTKTYLGKRGSILKETSQQANLITLDSPILSASSFDALTNEKTLSNKTAVFSTTYVKKETSLENSLIKLCEDVKKEIVENKKSVIILSDRTIKTGETAIPSLMALAKVHHFLIDEGIRLKASLVVVSGEVRDSHDLACHIAYGASAVWPYLALERVRQLSISSKDTNLTPEEAQENYRKALDKGLLKIMSKMGICTISSYRGSELFEVIGLNRDIVENIFKFTKTRTEGVGFKFLNDKLKIYGDVEDVESSVGGFFLNFKRLLGLEILMIGTSICQL